MRQHKHMAQTKGLGLGHYIIAFGLTGRTFYVCMYVCTACQYCCISVFAKCI